MYLCQAHSTISTIDIGRKAMSQRARTIALKAPSNHLDFVLEVCENATAMSGPAGLVLGRFLVLFLTVPWFGVAAGRVRRSQVSMG